MAVVQALHRQISKKSLQLELSPVKEEATLKTGDEYDQLVQTLKAVVDEPETRV